MRQALVLALVFVLAGGALAKGSKGVFRKDVEFALDQLEKQCGHLIEIKGIDWKKVRSRFRKEAKKVRTEGDEYLLLCRLIAALHDGHAYVKAPEDIRKSVEWPFDLAAGPGFFFCRIGDGIYVKSAWSNAKRSGVKPGMQVLTIDKEEANRWMAKRVEALGEYLSFSTDQQAFYFACHWGLGGPAGSRIRLQLKDGNGKKKTVTVTRGRASTVPVGPAFFPEGLTRIGRQAYGTLPSGYGYIHLRDTKGQVVEQMDEMLGQLGNVPGLILDFRANGGGGFDHDGLLGRFVPRGKSMSRSGARPIPSGGKTPYGGPVVVIVDAGVRSAGETGSGMFKEDGRAYMIGESPTAGMSSSKTTIDLPSGRFGLYVSVRSNKARFQGGKGIEGLGIQPHEIVSYDPKDLAEGKDTLIGRAEAILADFPRKKVPYRPERYGWKRE
ncbi:MAG: S41 family peptidase [Planctomycetota bacterium]